MAVAQAKEDTTIRCEPRARQIIKVGEHCLK
jgi:hypothetical protein